MTQETAKERIYRGALETMSDSDFMGNKYVKKFVKGVFKQIEDVPATTDKLSVEKIQEIRVEELKDFNSKILQAELKNQKLQKEIDAAKKYIEESYKADKEDNKLLDLIIEAVKKLKSDNETLKKALTEISSSREYFSSGETTKFLPTEDAQIAIDALAAIGGDDE